MSRLYVKMLALKPATGMKQEIGCDGLMHMIMRKDSHLHIMIVISNDIGEVVVLNEIRQGKGEDRHLY